MSFPVALQLFSVRDDLERDFEGTLKKVKDMGFQGVEFAGLYKYGASEVKKMLDDIGLEAVSAHVSIDEFLGDIEGTVEKYIEIGCKYAAIPSLPANRRPGADLWEQTIEDIKKIGTVAKKKGLQLMYHNHDFEFVKIGDDYALDILYEQIPADILETELDVCWVKVAGVNPAAYIAKYSGRANILHLKDFTGSKTENMYELIGDKTAKAEQKKEFGFRPVGYGRQDVPTLLEAAEKAGVKWLVVEQDSPSLGKSALECAKMSIDYLKTIL